jgi:hypothetical protein
MEKWNNGIMDEGQNMKIFKPNIPVFHHSTIPI